MANRRTAACAINSAAEADAQKRVTYVGC